MSELEDSELATNQYYIRNKDTFAGRNLREDRSLLPKRVVCPTDGAPDLASTLISKHQTL